MNAGLLNETSTTYFLNTTMSQTESSSISYPNKTVSHTGTNSDGYGQIFQIYIAPIICGFGIIGNSLSLFVLMSDRLKESPYVNLKALTTCNLFALLVSFPYLLFALHHKSYAWTWYNVYIFTPLTSLLTAAGIWIVVVMTVERFVYVKYPLRSRWMCSHSGVLCRICVVILMSIIVAIPKFFIYRIENSKVAYTDFRTSKVYTGIDIFCIVTIHVIPVIVLGVVNVLLIRTLKQARKKRHSENIRNNQEGGWKRDERRFTITLISIVVLNLCFIVPATVKDILVYLKAKRSVLVILYDISNTLLFCCLAFTFILYCAFNKRFLRALKEKFGFQRNVRTRSGFRSIRTTEMTLYKNSASE